MIKKGRRPFKNNMATASFLNLVFADYCQNFDPEEIAANNTRY